MWDGFIDTHLNCFAEGGEVFSDEGWAKGSDFVEEATEGPDIALAIVELSIPDFRGGVVGCL